MNQRCGMHQDLFCALTSEGVIQSSLTLKLSIIDITYDLCSSGVGVLCLDESCLAITKYEITTLLQ